ncbi:MAG TPA: M1 family metallopeptidase [Gemmatimonadales bacterium]|nr:M1 family metallopeptidase [Gemmatimonadales bacterium]
MRRFLVLAALGLGSSLPLAAQQQPPVFSHADTLRGSIGPGRAWWDVVFYDLHVKVDPADSSIDGWNGITYRVTGPQNEMQLDLQPPLELDSVKQGRRRLSVREDGSAWFVTLEAKQPIGAVRTVTAFYHGKPRVAKRPPWDGGFSWLTDSLGNRWVATTSEGIGASIWWPNKDTQADEPDSQRIAITVPDPMIDVSNGRLRSTVHHPDHTTTYEWFVADPINNYDVAVNAGSYAHWQDTIQGEAGPLTLDFWPLAYHLDTAKVQFQQAKTMLACFEHWFGPYPWYKDGYKLVETGHLGMEHQSGIAYGNHYKNGYLGRDLSHTGVGLGWDFIIVHESAHEWWGNNLTDQDVADMWIHESFANYAENLYVECQSGKAKGAEYVIGTRKNIRNDEPIVGIFGVNHEGSGDMYYKGGNMLHTIRQVINDDEKWRGILRGLNHDFWHQVVTGQQVRQYISDKAGIDLSRVFTQYLETTKVPVFEYKISGDTLSYHWADVVPGFAMPLRVTLADSTFSWIHPTEAWQTAPVHPGPAGFKVDENFYVIPKDLNAPPPAVDSTGHKS